VDPTPVRGRRSGRGETVTAGLPASSARVTWLVGGRDRRPGRRARRPHGAALRSTMAAPARRGPAAPR
jgi:hypothetical protein